MAFTARRFPGGLFPRLVALFSLLFPLYLVQGVLLGVPVNLPEVFLLAIFFYFLFEHDSFRMEAWNLWSVFAFFLLTIAFVSSGPFEIFTSLKSWILFPALYFVIARNVFREKPSMVLLAQKTLIVLAGLLSCVLLQESASLGSFEALSVFVGPGLVLAGLSAFYSESRWHFAGFFAVFLLCFFALFYSGFIFTLCVSLLTMLFYGLLRSKVRGRLVFGGLGVLFLLLLVGFGFYISQTGNMDFQVPEIFLNSLPLQILGGLIALTLLWMSSKALLWIGEKDEVRRHFVAVSFLCFLILLGFYLPFLAVSHLFLLWLFMAILL